MLVVVTRYFGGILLGTGGLVKAYSGATKDAIAKAEEDKAIEMLRILFEYFAKHPYEMPEIYRKNLKNEDVARCVCDYISSMTDRYAIDLFRELYVPAMWRRHL